MKTESKVLLNRTEFTEPLIAEAKRVAALGGSFAMQNVYSDNWYLVVTINYPEGVSAAIKKAEGQA
jgi:hypothetical protein